MFFFVIPHLVPEIFKIIVLCKLGTDDVIRCDNMEVKVTANLFGLEFCKILKSYHNIAHYIYFVLKKKLF